MLQVLFAVYCLFITMAVQEIPKYGEKKTRMLMSIKDLINYHGYPCEEYGIVTTDGYILSTYRIPHGRKENTSSSSKPVVFLLHGMLGDASDWISNAARNSLGFVLADNGCDVWLGNSRGSVWSRKHVSLSTDDENFWAFSFDHMAQYDLPASIDFILQKTGQQQVFYVGHSQGSTIGFIAFSTMPELARKIKMNIALAPVVTVKYAIDSFRNLFTLPEFIYKIIFGTKEFYWIERISGDNQSGFCSFLQLSNICHSTMFNLFGSKTQNMSQVEYAVYLAPGTTSVQNLIHWSQVLKSNKLRAYDFGTLENLVRYKQTRPPEYNITTMNVPTAVWSGGRDAFADSRDIALLLSQITNLTYYKSIPDWDHVSFISGLDANVQLYSEILRMIEKYN